MSFAKPLVSVGEDCSNVWIQGSMDFLRPLLQPLLPQSTIVNKTYMLIRGPPQSLPPLPPPTYNNTILKLELINLTFYFI